MQCAVETPFDFPQKSTSFLAFEERLTDQPVVDLKKSTPCCSECFFDMVPFYFEELHNILLEGKDISQT